MAAQTQSLQIRRVVNERSKLDPVCVSCTAPEDDDLTFAVTDHWKVVLHPDQTVPGALLLTSLRHVPKLSELTLAESIDWFELFSTAEATLEQTMGADLVTVMCQRNWAFRADDPEPPLLDGHPNPHVHWHVAPRYRNMVTIGHESFEDETFGDLLVWRSRRVKPATQALLIESIYRGLVGQPGSRSTNRIQR